MSKESIPLLSRRASSAPTEEGDIPAISIREVHNDPQDKPVVLPGVHVMIRFIDIIT